MARRDLPDIYALARGLQAEGMGIYIYQANPPKFTLARLALYIKTF